MAGRGGPSLGQGRGKGTDYSINKDVTPFWEHAGLEGALHCPFPKDTWLPYSLEQVEGGCELPNAGQDLWAGVISTLLGQMPQDKHQPVSPAPPPPFPPCTPGTGQDSSRTSGFYWRVEGWWWRRFQVLMSWVARRGRQKESAGTYPELPPCARGLWLRVTTGKQRGRG